MDHRIDGVDRDGAAALDLRALVERRFRVEAGSRAISLRSTICTIGRSSVLTIASMRWPRAAARVSVAPGNWAKSALPEITALAEPTRRSPRS